MDLNIGAALWLAARARGRLRVFGPAAKKEPEEAGPSRETAELGSPCSCQDPGAQDSPKHQGSWTAKPEEAGPSCAASACSRQDPGGQDDNQHQGVWMSQARVVLLGQGADEQCGGYGRYRTRFREAVRTPCLAAAAG